jgi:hypothetical protein
MATGAEGRCDINLHTRQYYNILSVVSNKLTSKRLLVKSGQQIAMGLQITVTIRRLSFVLLVHFIRSCWRHKIQQMVPILYVNTRT